MKHILVFLFLLIITKETYPQNLFSDEPEVRVRIIDSISELKVSFRGQWTIASGDHPRKFSKMTGIVLISFEDGEITVLKNKEKIYSSVDGLSFRRFSNSGDILIQDVPYGAGWWWEGKEDRIYDGEIYIYPGDVSIRSNRPGNAGGKL